MKEVNYKGYLNRCVMLLRGVQEFNRDLIKSGDILYCEKYINGEKVYCASDNINDAIDNLGDALSAIACAKLDNEKA